MKKEEQNKKKKHREEQDKTNREYETQENVKSAWFDV